MKYKIFSLLLTLLVIVNLAVSAGAVELPEQRIGVCAIDVTVQYQGKNIKDGKLTAVRVGYIDQEDYNFFFRSVFKDEIIDNVGSWGSVDNMYEFYRDEKHNYAFYTKTVNIKDGVASFTDLDTGLYLIIQETASTGYSVLSPFLVSVPYWDGDQYQYKVDAKVKTELEKEPPETTSSSSSTKPHQKLPQTGQLSWPIPWMTVSGMALFAVGWWLCFGSRKDF